MFPATYLIWFLSELILNRLLRSKSTDKQNVDRGSLSLIWLTIIIANTVAYLLAINSFYPISDGHLIGYIGLAVICIGIFVRLLVVRALGRLFTVDVTIRQNHQLKTDGFYRFIRHPSYSASLVSFIGFGLSLNNWLSLALVIAAALTVFIVRIKIEEKTLIDQFGETYLDYKKRTWGIIPFLY